MENKIDKFFDYLLIILVTIALSQIVIYGLMNKNIDKIMNEKNKTEYVKR